MPDRLKSFVPDSDEAKNAAGNNGTVVSQIPEATAAVEHPHERKMAPMPSSENTDPKLTGLKGTAGVIAQFGLLTVFAAALLCSHFWHEYNTVAQEAARRDDVKEERKAMREDQKLEREMREKENGVQRELVDGIRRTGVRIEKATDKLDAILQRIEKQ